MGALGGWIGFLFETTIGAALFARRWNHGSWRKAYAGSPADKKAGGPLMRAAA